jgi:UDP-N-acetylmuramoyl-L-alanyl-D-glutamate--2,6-diaminopimelate ligase
MMKLKELFKGEEERIRISGDPDLEFQFLTPHSNEVQAETLFAALRGEVTDGHRFIEDAVQRGAKAVLCERIPEGSWKNVTWIETKDTRSLFPLVAERFFGDPAKDLKLIGVTGTNGKTTATFLLEHLLQGLGGALLVGTVEYRIGWKHFPSGNTTPGVFELNRLMRETVDDGLHFGVFEVSSHALKQNRVRGLRFNTAIFMNLTQDHLDYHKTFEDYYESKRRLFTENQPVHSLINIDDEYGRRLVGEIKSRSQVVTFSVKGSADSWASDIELSLGGSSFLWHWKGSAVRVESRLVCLHSVYNLLAALTAAQLQGLSLEAASEAVRTFSGVPGRMERVGDNLPFSVFVDYAHTPDAFENVLSSTRRLVPEGTARILTVFGCGGDRDKTKRPLMAQTACKYSDLLFLTSDNPRTENPEDILDDIERGLTGGSFSRIPDRQQAIEATLKKAQPGDVVLILGKGHEDYQIVGREKFHFSDREVVEKWAGAPAGLEIAPPPLR